VSISESDDAKIIAEKVVAALNEAEDSAYIQELYIKGCEALWMQGVQKEKCATAFAKIIRDLKFPDDPDARWDSGHYWRVVKEHGFTPAGNETSAQGRNKTSSPILPVRLDIDDPKTWVASPYAGNRIPYILLLKNDQRIDQRIIDELEKNYEDKEDPETGKIEPDLSNPRKWDHLFASVDINGHLVTDPPEVVDAFFQALRRLQVKMQTVIEKYYLDGRQALMPWKIFPIKARSDIISKAHFGKKYYVMFKRKEDITTKKITQFESSEDTYASFLNFVADDPRTWGYCDFIPCPNCIEKETDPKKCHLMQMHPAIDGTWKWRCANCGQLFNPKLLKKAFEEISADKNGLARIYLQKEGMPIPESTKEEAAE